MKFSIQVYYPQGRKRREVKGKIKKKQKMKQMKKKPKKITKSNKVILIQFER